jgi:hypothetical protein
MALTDGARTLNATTGNLKRLVVAVDENAATLPDVSVEKAAVVSALSDAEDAARRQTFHGAQRTQATLDMNAALARGVEAGVRLQNAVRFKLGKKDEKLAEFQLKPQRPRKSPAKRVTATERAKNLEEELAAAKGELAALKERFKVQPEGDTPA